MDAIDTYIQQVFETALYFRDMHEENNDGQTTAIQLLKPIKSIQNKVVRKFLLHDLYKSQNSSLREAAVQFARWHPDDADLLPFKIDDIQAKLETLCLEHQRPTQLIRDKETLTRRSFLRAARYMHRIHEEGAPAHSRVVELFVPETFVPQGEGCDGPEHREHVVPCVYLRDECLRRYKNGAIVEAIADFLQRHVVVIKISKEQQKHLDGSMRNGHLGLKNKMPEGWEPDRDCIFQRLHEAKISFTPPKGFNSCDIHGCQLDHASN